MGWSGIASRTASTRGTGDPARRDVAHLLRRAGFGGSAATVDALAELGYEGAVDALVTPVRDAAADPTADAVPAPVFDTAGYRAARDGTPEERRAAAAQARAERRQLVLWSVRRMAVATHPLREKLAFLWHDHFATSIEKVKLAQLLFEQHATLRDLGGGRFDELVHAIARDPAMLIWLDGRESTAAAPNENFARELLELFTLGHQAPAASTPGGHEHDGDGHQAGQPYTESDVAEAARALTGWTIDPSGAGGVLRPGRFDRGTKTVLGTTGALGLDEVVAITTRHPACAPHIVATLWSRLARPAGPNDPVVRELASSFARDLDTTALLRSIFLHPEFRSDSSRTGLVKTPVEYVVGMHRALGVTPTGAVLVTLDALGQTPFAPPDVSGWTANEGWLSTASALARLQLASTIDPGGALAPVADAASADRPAAVARLLGIDGWSETTASALDDAAGDPRRLLTVALVSPEHVLN
jgi:uncharacterized protein (DUF1800 family)